MAAAYGVTAATSVGSAPPRSSSSRGGASPSAGIDGASLLGTLSLSEQPSPVQAGGMVQSWGRGPARLVWTVPRYLASTDPATYGIGLGFVKKTFALCVACFGLTCCMTGGLLVLWGHGLERLVFTDVCTHYTHWSCTQWTVDGVLVLFIIPVKFCYGMFHGWTVPMLLLLAIFQSANLALLGCFSRSFAPIATQTFITFWVALVTIWLACVQRERRLVAQLLREVGDAGSVAAAASDQNGAASLQGGGGAARNKLGGGGCQGCCCCDWVGSNGRWSGWGDGWGRLAIYGVVSVTTCNFLLMLLKLWLDEPSTFLSGVRIATAVADQLAGQSVTFLLFWARQHA